MASENKTRDKKGIFKNIQLYLSLPFQLQINSLIFLSVVVAVVVVVVVRGYLKKSG